MGNETTKDYTKTILLNATPEKTFAAIATGLNNWWGKTDLESPKAGSEFTIVFKNDYWWKFRIIEFDLNTKITWKCINGEPEFNKEWIGSTLHWRIEEDNNKTKLFFLHEGLTANLSCFDVCTDTWSMLITESLKSYLETGKGMPLK